MLKTYIDKGFREDIGGVLTVAAALFKKSPYTQFKRRWEPLLKPWGATAFHATDFYPGGGEFSRRLPDKSIDPERLKLYKRQSEVLPQIVADEAHELFVVSVNQGEFDAVTPKNFRERFGSLHGLMAQTLIHRIGHWADEAQYRQPIAYFHETGDDDCIDVKNRLDGLFEKESTRKHARMISNVTFIEKGYARGLEAADFLAWHWNKFYIETVALRKRPQRKDLDALLNSFRLKGKKVHVSVFTGDALDKFLISHGCHRNVTAASVLRPFA